jgi:hypothetical protein
MVEATVLIPTHNHGPTVRLAVSSVLDQTDTDIEVLVVGDGVPDVTREIMGEITGSDRRVRFFDNPKGARNGELHRHAALATATGRIVCYLSDDDLWTPWHLETMSALLEDADVAHTLPVQIGPDGSITVQVVDLARAQYRRLLLESKNRIPLACFGHTLAMYRRLPHGWRPAPTTVASDLYMYRQFLADESCRAASGFRPTAIVLPNPARRGWPAERRVEEIGEWRRRMVEPGFELAWHREIVADLDRQVQWFEATRTWRITGQAMRPVWWWRRKRTAVRLRLGRGGR